VKLPPGVKSWKELAAMSPEEICEKGVWPRGFLPLPHPNHPEGGMVFPKHHIYEIMKQEGRDLTRFDLDFDLPEHLLPEFPPPIYLTTRTDLGDVSQGQVVTLQNYFKLFNGMLNPKQLEGLRLLVPPFPQQQYNASCRNSARVILLPVVNEILSQIAASSSLCVFMMMLPQGPTEGQRTIVHTWDILPGMYLSARAIDRAKAKEPCCLLSAHRSL
jgi:hypothetical protein